MAEDETAPLLPAASSVDKTDKPNEVAANSSGETTPLLSRSSETPRYDGEHDGSVNADAASVSRSHRSRGSRRLSDASSTHSWKNGSPRWASFVAMALLAGTVMAIIGLAFVLPDAVQEYAKASAVVEPTKLSLESITPGGVRARIQAKFRLDGSKVDNPSIRTLGRAATWIAKKLETGQTEVDVSLPDYESIALGTAIIPPLEINLRNGQTTDLDFVTDIVPGEVEKLRVIANQWLDGRLDQLRLQGVASVPLSSGIFSLGTQRISESLVFEADNIPDMPQYNITRIHIKDVKGPGNQTSMLAEASLTIHNEYPIQLTVPELAFEVLVPGCKEDNDYIVVADAVTSEVQVRPQSDVAVDAYSLFREIERNLTRVCPDTESSPLDTILKQYMHGQPGPVFVRGSSLPDGDTPQWMSKLLSSVTLPIPFPGRPLGNLIKNFSLTDVHFELPDPWADPEDPASNPTVSGNILVMAGVPSEMNLGINVTNVRAFADVFHDSGKLGELNLSDWQNANSTRVGAKKGEDQATLKIQSRINNAPLNITDADVFSDVIQALMFGGERVVLTIKALIDVKVKTALGEIVLKDVPAEGRIPVKPFTSGKTSLLDRLDPKVRSLDIIDTTSSSVSLEVLVNITNPTPYTIHLPYANVHVLVNDTILAEATVLDAHVMKGANPAIFFSARWDPAKGGTSGPDIGREFISQYLSGYNTTVTVKAHRASIPGQPILSDALSRFNLTFATPKLRLPGHDSGSDDPAGEGGGAHFVRDATFHFLSSTAIFSLASPLKSNTLYIDAINATALYNHTEPVGTIMHYLPFKVPPGISTTPKLPVSWSVDSIGYDAVKRALGGQLKLDAVAQVTVRLGNWRERVWFEGKGIGAKVRL